MGTERMLALAVGALMLWATPDARGEAAGRMERPFVIVQPGIANPPKARDLQDLAAEHEPASWLVCLWQIGAILEDDHEIARFSAFLPPKTASARLRRGFIKRGFVALDPHTGKLGWMDDGGQFFKEYAQVSFLGHPLGAELRAPTQLELPFAVRGKLRDADLVAIVDLVRQRQHKEASGETLTLKRNADGSFELSVDPEVTGRPMQPFGYLERKADGSVEVSTVQDKAAWRSYRLSRRHGVWKIVEVGDAIA